MKEKKALLVVSFGTSYGDTLKKTIEACEAKLAGAFPGYDLKRAFTSHIIIRKLRKQQGIEVDTPVMVLERLVLEGYTHVLVQPLHIIPGEEYSRKVIHPISPFRKKFASFAVGKPLLYQFEDYEKTLDALEAHMPSLQAKEALVLMGHGSDHPANSTYSCLQSMADDRELPFHIGCVEGYPYLERVMVRLKKREIRKAHLLPLMLVAGDHARNDMASDEDDSWKTQLEEQGFATEIHMAGLGENPLIQEMFVRKAQEALEEAE